MKTFLRVVVLALVLGLAGCAQGPAGLSSTSTKNTSGPMGKALPHSLEVMNTTRKLTYLDDPGNFYFNTTADWRNISYGIWWSRSLPTEPGGDFPLFIDVKRPDGSSTGLCGGFGAEITTENSGPVCGGGGTNWPGMWTIQITGRTQKTLHFSVNETDPKR